MNRRQFASVLGAGALDPAGPLAAASPQDAGPWYRKLTPGIHLDYHFPEWDPYLVSRADGAGMVRTMAATAAEMIVVFAKCHYGNAYYPTRVGHQHANLHRRDLLKEWVAEAKRQRLTVLAYYSVNRDVWAGQRHPEWRMKDPAGKVVDEDRWPPEWASMGFLCYNSPYLEYVKAQVSELLDYEIDGFHFDMLWFGHTGLVCYCREYCRPLFRQRYGIEMPESPAWDGAWRRFLEFRYDSNARFCRELSALIKSRRPEVSVMYNYHATPPNSWQEGMRPVQHRAISDYGTGEGYPPRFGHNYASFMSCFLANVAPGTPWQGVTSRYTRGINDKTVRPLADMKWEMFTYLAHGGMPLFVDTPGDDGNSLDPVAYERMRAAFREFHVKRPYFGYEPVREAGLYFSSKTRDWYGRMDAQRYFRSFVGAHRVLIESHIPVGFVFDENVTIERLRQFPLIYLADTAILTPAEAELFRQYVREGGRLLATSETGRFDENGREKADFDLADLFGAHYRGKTEIRGNYFRVPEGFASAGLRPDWDIFISGPNNVVTAAGGATAYGELKVAFHDRDLHTHVGHAPHNSPWKPVGPALIVNSYGRGTAAYIPFGPEAAYAGDYPLPEHRMFSRNVLRHLLPPPPISVQAPLNVESVITRDRTGRRCLVHLVAFVSVRDGQTQASGDTLIPAMEEQWRYRARVAMTHPLGKVFAASPSSTLHTSARAVEIETDQVHETLIIELG